jgi:hypothetical protein
MVAPILPPATPFQNLTPVRRYVAPQSGPLSYAESQSSPQYHGFHPCSQSALLPNRLPAHLLLLSPIYCYSHQSISWTVRMTIATLRLRFHYFLAHQTPISVQGSGWLLSHPTLHLVYRASRSSRSLLLNTLNASKSLHVSLISSSLTLPSVYSSCVCIHSP